jgi:hypothetical protein
MAKTRVIDDHYGWVKARINGWSEHLDLAHDTLKKVVTEAGSEEYPWPRVAQSLLELGLDCYDKAYGWMLPSSGAEPERKPAPEPENPRGRGGRRNRGR